MIRLLHTSDWHLGRTLCGNKRDDEFYLFLKWLVQSLQLHRIDVLLIAGDIFDSPAPSVAAQQLYYDFLRQLVGSSCRHVVIIAGNHDSPAFLEAPRGVLKEIGVHVVGAARSESESEVIALRNPAGDIELVVAAVPFLRDRDVRSSSYGESDADRDQALVEGVRDHYAAVTAECLKLLPSGVPLVAMGHLFAAGSTVSSGDGVRELYIGSLGQVPCSVFPQDFDYVALGHLHRMQQAATLPEVWYSGSPLPMGFGEAASEKFVRVLEFHPTAKRFSLRSETIAVPSFRRLASLSGDLESLLRGVERELLQLREQPAPLGTWLEVIYQGNEIAPDLSERLASIVNGSKMEILRIRAAREGVGSWAGERPLAALEGEGDAQGSGENSALADDEAIVQIFERCLEFNRVPDDQRAMLRELHHDVVQNLGLQAGGR
jgi:exonuclease SbcD